MAKSKAKLNLEEAATHLGISTDELMASRWRGMAPGSLGFKEAGVLLFNKADLTPPKSSKAKAEEEADGE